MNQRKFMINVFPFTKILPNKTELHNNEDGQPPKQWDWDIWADSKYQYCEKDQLCLSMGASLSQGVISDNLLRRGTGGGG